MKRIYAVSLVGIFGSFLCSSNAVAGGGGSYRSRVPGPTPWQSLEAWEVDDGSWRPAEEADGVPGELDEVRIQPGHTILLESTQHILDLRVYAGDGEVGPGVLDIRGGQLTVHDEIYIFRPSSESPPDSPPAKVVFSAMDGSPGMLQIENRATVWGVVEVTGEAGGILRINPDGILVVAPGSGGFRVTGGPLWLDASFEMDGKIVVDGPFALTVLGSGPRVGSSGTWTIAHSEATLRFDTEGDVWLRAATINIEAGTLHLSQELYLTGGLLTLNGTRWEPTGNNARVTGPGTLRAAGLVVTHNEAVIETTLRSEGGSFDVVDGLLVLSSPQTIESSSMRVQAKGTSILQVDPGVVFHGRGSFEYLSAVANYGEIRAKDGELQVRKGSDASAAFDPTGIVGTENEAGILTVFGNWSTLDGRLDLKGGRVTGGEITNTGTTSGVGAISPTLFNEGVLAPGASLEGIGDQTGILVFESDFHQDSPGQLEISISGLRPGAQYDQIIVQNLVSLGGELVLQVSSEYTPACCDRFVLMEYQTVSGDFDQYVGLDLGPLIFEPILGADSLSLWVRDNPDVEGDGCGPYGDANRDGVVDLVDILCVLDGFAGVSNGCTFEEVDIHPCGGDSIIDLRDILAVLDGFSSN